MTSIRRESPRTRGAAIVWLVLAAICSGCVNLEEIRAFSASAAAVGERFPGVAQDFYDSCMSQQRFIVAQKQDFRLDKFADLNDPANPEMEAGRKLCQPFADEKPRLIAANATLVAYMRSMGDLAADDLTNFDKSIGDFGTALTGAGLLDAAQSSAVSKLASYLARMATDQYRRKQLRTAVKDTNADIQTLSTALASIVSKKYVLQLENEREAMRAYYRKLAAESARFSRQVAGRAQGGTASSKGDDDVVDPVPLEDLRSRFDAKNAEMNTKIAGAVAYGRVLGAVARGHQELNDHADQLNSRALLSAVLAEARTIQSLANDFIKAF